MARRRFGSERFSGETVAHNFLSLGSINADFQFEADGDLSGGGTIKAKSLAMRGGGKAANRAVLAQRLGLSASLMGQVGDDHFVRQTLEPLEGTGVDLSPILTRKAAMTAISMIVVPEGGEKTILLAGGANLDWDDAGVEAIERWINGAAGDAVLTIDFEISPAAIEKALAAAGRRGIKVVADGSFGEAVETRHLRQIHAIAPNENEALAIAGLEESSAEALKTSARQMLAAGVSVVSIKLADGGCLLATADGLERIAAPQVEPKDQTGAGDAFTAALAVAFQQGKSARDAAIYGVAAATLAVTQSGSHEAYPEREAFAAMVRTIQEQGNYTPYD